MLIYRLLIHLEQSQSFSKTAEEYGLVVSTLSRKFEKFEKEIGTKLLIKSTHGIRLTLEAKELLRRIRSSIIEIEDALNEISHPDYKIQKVLRMTTFESFGQKVLVPVVAKLLGEYNQMNVDIDLSNNLYSTSDHKFDLYFRIGKPKDSSMLYKKIVDNQLGIFATEKFINTFNIKKPKDLENVNCLTINSQCKSTKLSIKTAKKVYDLNVKGNLSCKGGGPIEEMVVSNLAVGILPTWFADKNSKLKQLFSHSTVSVKGITASEVYAVYPSELRGDPRIKCLFSFFD